MKLLRYIKVFSSVLVMLLVASSCSDLDSLMCPVEHTLYLKVVDLYGSDITEDGDIETADLYVFDNQGLFERKVTLTKKQIIQKEPIRFKMNGKGRIVAWANLKDKEHVEEGRNIDLSSIQLIKTTDGFLGAPDDLFFGTTEVSKNNIVNEIVVSRKISQMNITVRGLPKGKTADDYDFKIRQHYKGYTFKGMPILSKSEMKQKGVFKANNDFVSPFPFNLIHTIEGTSDEITVALTGASGEELAVAHKDVNNRLITPKAGETVNVLIDLSDTNLRICIEVTDWNNIIQWAEW